MNTDKKSLPKKSQNLSDWYNAVVMQAQLADYGPARGTMIYRPYGYAIWENIQSALDKEIKLSGAENAYFPLFIPESLLQHEKAHIEGFAPELAIVTYGGGEELKERLVVRPTSETIMYDAYSRWIQSWRDLPMVINQWNNVVRWEKRTYLFLRTLEFLWQEGHGAYATQAENWDRVLWGIHTYAKIYQDFLAVPGIIGRKSESERFAGGVVTLAYEALMPEGKALQGCTSHDLGQNFSKAQNVSFQDKQGKTQFVWQNSWGFTTRSIGGMLMVHGDDAGIVLPPRVAPVQVVILTVRDDENIITYAENILQRLQAAGVRAKLDKDSEKSIGYKINEWEIKGVPVRLELGAREAKENNVTMAIRHSGEKTTVALENFLKDINSTLDAIHTAMYKKAEKFLTENTHEIETWEDFKKQMAGDKGFIKAFWCEDAACEAKIKEETKATTRCLPLDSKDEKGKCVHCGNDAKHKWFFAQAY